MNSIAGATALQPIRREVVVKPRDVSAGLYTFLGFIFLCALCSIVAGNVFIGFFIGLFIFIVACTAGSISFIGRVRQTNARVPIINEAKAAMRKAARGELLASFAEISAIKGKSGLTATGIAWDGENLIVIDAGELGIIPVPRIRNWKWSIAGRTHHSAASLNPGYQMQARIANEEEAAKQYVESGLFINVIDLEKPTWHVMTTDKAILERWNELLTQIDEGQHRAIAQEALITS